MERKLVKIYVVIFKDQSEILTKLQGLIVIKLYIVLHKSKASDFYVFLLSDNLDIYSFFLKYSTI